LGETRTARSMPEEVPWVQWPARDVAENAYDLDVRAARLVHQPQILSLAPV